MSKTTRNLPEHLHDAHSWTEAAGELEQLASLQGDALDTYARESAANAREHNEGVSESDLRELNGWLRG